MAPPPSLLARIRAQSFANDGARPIVTLEEFFAGNDDLGSIGCNLARHPGTQRFYEVLRAVRARSDVQDVLIAITEDMGDDQWPFSDCVYVLTSARSEDVARWVDELEPDPLKSDGFFPAAPRDAPALRPGFRAHTLWWD
jgi:hypothetical protein